MVKFNRLFIAAAFGAMAHAGPASAIINGGFETGVFGAAWVGFGNVEVVSPSNFAPAVPAPGGVFFALLSTNPDAFVGVISPFDLDLANGNELDVSIIEQTFVAPLSGTLRFDVSMLTSESETRSLFVDIAACDVDGFFVYEGASANVLAGSAYPGIFPFGGPFDGISTLVTSGGFTNGSVFARGLSVFLTTVSVHLSAGVHTFSCIVGDGWEGTGDSGLILDNVVFTEDAAGGAVGCLIPSGAQSGWMWAVLGMMLGGIILARRRV